MKKLLSAVVAALAACLLFVLVGCEPADVNGKTYTYDHVKAIGDGSMDTEFIMQAEWWGNTNIGMHLKGASLSFKDGKLTMKKGSQSEELEYTQDGETITAGTQKLYVDGNSVYMETYSLLNIYIGITFRIYYKA